MSTAQSELYYDILLTSLGALVVTVTDDGLRFIKHYDTIPAARIDTLLKLTQAKRSPERLSKFMTAIVAYLDGSSHTLDLPLDLQGGTELQRKVWEELMNIPYGTTITYSDLASRVKNPDAVRAVASACGKNPIPLIIPCHRVVSKDGLGGFGWGLDKKQQLLELETPEDA